MTEGEQSKSAAAGATATGATDVADAVAPGSTGSSLPSGSGANSESAATEPKATEEPVWIAVGDIPKAVSAVLTSPGRPLYPGRAFIMLHGHGGHKNYCYQPTLAAALAANGDYSLRFDFRNCGESVDIASPDGRTITEDVTDIAAAVAFLKARKLEVHGLIGHSRGSVAMFEYFMKVDNSVPLLVNCAGRYRTEKIKDRVAAQRPNWVAEGGHKARMKRHRQETEVFIPLAETLSVASVDMGSLVLSLRPRTAVLSVHGLEDAVVPVQDSAMFANALGSHHTLHLVAGADHNFYQTDAAGRRHSFAGEVADVVAAWASTEGERRRFLVLSNALDMTGGRRWQAVEGVANFRDLGGWTLPGGTHRVRPGVVYRSALPNKITDSGCAALRDLGVATSFDFRSEDECRKNGIYAVPGVERRLVPVHRQEDLSPEELVKKLLRFSLGTEGYVMVYQDFLQSGVDAYRAVAEHVRDREEPLLMHCTAGKDRTGIMGMLLLQLAGLDDDTIAREYELTTYGLADDYDNMLAHLEAAIGKFVSRDAMASMLQSRYETMRLALDMLRRDFGGAEGYLRDHVGLSETDLAKLRERLVEPVEPSVTADGAWRTHVASKLR
ncbi:protein-tyrosine phosphatase-like protein [Dipodascopsis tothii]|uniref:protein-tyrosine phosphatase-like protein n=1 Tax=Dipodascopsis tothii TaxID=44089 RepID=UPI0034CF0641